MGWRTHSIWIMSNRVIILKDVSRMVRTNASTSIHPKQAALARRRTVSFVRKSLTTAKATSACTWETSVPRNVNQSRITANATRLQEPWDSRAMSYRTQSIGFENPRITLKDVSRMEEMHASTSIHLQLVVSAQRTIKSFAIARPQFNKVE